MNKKTAIFFLIMSVLFVFAVLKTFIDFTQIKSNNPSEEEQVINKKPKDEGENENNKDLNKEKNDRQNKEVSKKYNKNLINEEDLLKIHRKAILIDLRDDRKYREAHIKGSLRYIDLSLDDLDKNKPIVLIVDNEVSPTKLSEIFSKLSQKTSSTIKIYSNGIRSYDERGGSIIMKNNMDNFKDLAKVRFISAQEAHKLIKENPGEFLLLDVRRKNIYDKSHIEGAINIPYLELEQRYKELPTNKKIIVYGANEKQSFLAGALLYDLSIFRVNTIKGGYPEWEKYIKSETQPQTKNSQESDTTTEDTKKQAN